MKRTNLYLTEKQVERLQRRAEKEGLAIAELVRRAVDAFWRGMIRPIPHNPSLKKGTPIHPRLKKDGVHLRRPL